MKIIFLSDDFPPNSFGGAGVSTYELALAIKKIGHEVSVVTTCRTAAEACESEYNGLKIYNIFSDYNPKWRAYLSLYNPGAIKELKKIFIKEKPDVVHVNNVHFYLSYVAIPLSKKYAKAVVFTARDAMSFSFGKLNTKKYLENFDAKVTWLDNLRQARKGWNPLRNFFIRKYLGYADVVLSVSNALKKALDQNGIKNVVVMHTGSSVSDRQVTANEVEDFKRQYGLENKKILLFSGRISEAKGGKHVLESLAKVIEAFPETILLIAGKTDAYSDKMKEDALGLNVGEAVKFIGWIEKEKTKYVYASSDIILVPSVTFDAFPRTVLSGMAAGKPVIGTTFGGAPELIQDGVTGYVVNPFNTEEMSKKIIDLLSNPDKAEKFGKASLHRIETEFNLEDKAKKHIALYTEYINK